MFGGFSPHAHLYVSVILCVNHILKTWKCAKFFFFPLQKGKKKKIKSFSVIEIHDKLPTVFFPSSFLLWNNVFLENCLLTEKGKCASWVWLSTYVTTCGHPGLKRTSVWPLGHGNTSVGARSRCGYDGKHLALLFCTCALLLSAGWSRGKVAWVAWLKVPWFQLVSSSSNEMCCVHGPAVWYNRWLNFQEKVLCSYFVWVFALGLILLLLLINSFDKFSLQKRCLFLFEATPPI